MKAEISRNSHQPKQRYSGVYQQQGRMLTDADWNEMVDVVKDRARDALRDVVGSGIPEEHGLRVWHENNRWYIQPGVVFVDGIRGEIFGTDRMAFVEQPDFPGCPVPTIDDNIYVDVWERPVLSTEDVQLRDEALHGADTCFRTQTMVQVKCCPSHIDPENVALNPRLGSASLAIDPAEYPKSTGNSLFRLEVHDISQDGRIATLKWSSQNGAEQLTAVSAVFDSAVRRVYEVFADRTQKALSEKQLGVHLGSHIPVRGELTDHPRSPKGQEDPDLVRLWDGFCEIDLDRLQTNKKSDDLELCVSTLEPRLLELRLRNSGLTLRLALIGSKPFVAGDYWLVPIRGGKYVSPYKVQDGRSTGQGVAGAVLVHSSFGPPQGIHHHYLKLEVGRGGANAGRATDGRFRFPQLSNLAFATNHPLDTESLLETYLPILSEDSLNVKCRSVAVGDDGDIYVTGVRELHGDVKPRVFVSAVGLDGQVRWSVDLWVSTHDAGQQVATVGDSIIVAAACSGNLMGEVELKRGLVLAVLDTRGNVKHPPGPCQLVCDGTAIPYAIALRKRGKDDATIAVAGIFSSSLTAENKTIRAVGANDVFLLTCDLNLRCQCLEAIGGESYESANGLAIDKSGDVWLVGTFLDKLQFANRELNAPKKSDVLVAKFRPVLDTGVFQCEYAEQFGGPYSDCGWDIVVDEEDDSVYITGSFQDHIRFGGTSTVMTASKGRHPFLAKLDSEGRHLWSRQFHSTRPAEAYAVAIDPSRQLVAVAGTFSGNLAIAGTELKSAGETDGFVAFFTTSGAFRCCQKLGGALADWGRAIAFLNDGEIIVALDSKKEKHLVQLSYNARLSANLGQTLEALSTHKLPTGPLNPPRNSLRYCLPGLKNLPDNALVSMHEIVNAVLCELDAASIPYDASPIATDKKSIREIMDAMDAKEVSAPRLTSGVVEFDSKCVGIVMLSDPISPGLGSGPIQVSLAQEVSGQSLVFGQVSQESSDEIVQLGAIVDLITGTFRVAARNAHSLENPLKVRWWASGANDTRSVHEVTPRISVSPAWGEVVAGGTLQFVARITGVLGCTIKWSIIPQGAGTINESTGLYAAPTDCGAGPVSVEVHANCAEDPNFGDMAIVSLRALPAIEVTSALPDVYVNEPVDLNADVRGYVERRAIWTAQRMADDGLDGEVWDSEGNTSKPTTSSLSQNVAAAKPVRDRWTIQPSPSISTTFTSEVAGKFGITAKSLANPTLTKEVQVVVKSLSLVVHCPQHNLYINDRFGLSADVTPTDAQLLVEWSSSDGQKDTGDSAHFTFPKAGTYKVTATVMKGAIQLRSEETSVKILTAPVPKRTVSIKTNQSTIEAGGSLGLSAQVTPPDVPTDPAKITWRAASQTIVALENAKGKGLDGLIKPEPFGECNPESGSHTVYTAPINVNEDVQVTISATHESGGRDVRIITVVPDPRR